MLRLTENRLIEPSNTLVDGGYYDGAENSLALLCGGYSVGMKRCGSQTCRGLSRAPEVHAIG
jgi:hypothetical protein